MVKLKYMVVPKWLELMGSVENPVMVKVLDSEADAFKGILGESGKTLAKAGALFYFEEDIAENLAKQGVVEIISKQTASV